MPRRSFVVTDYHSACGCPSWDYWPPATPILATSPPYPTSTSLTSPRHPTNLRAALAKAHLIHLHLVRAEALDVASTGSRRAPSSWDSCCRRQPSLVPPRSLETNPRCCLTQTHQTTHFLWFSRSHVSMPVQAPCDSAPASQRHQFYRVIGGCTIRKSCNSCVTDRQHSEPRSGR